MEALYQLSYSPSDQVISGSKQDTNHAPRIGHREGDRPTPATVDMAEPANR
jgi:hypothetical protein